MKIIKLLLPLIVSLAVLTIATSAEELFFEPSTAYQDGCYTTVTPTVAVFSVSDTEISDLKGRIEECWTSLGDKIDISDFGLSSNTEVEEYIIPIYKSLLNDSPEYFYVSGSFRYSTERIIPYYIFDKEDIPGMIVTFNDAVNKALSCVDASTMSDIDIALALHDYLVLNAVYDNETFISQDQTHPTSFSAYGILVNKLGVCQGYTLAYNLLLKKCGINVGVASGPDVRHIWSLVEIDGSYYHVDVTWDDPLASNLKSREGISRYTYFLGSDESFRTDSMHGSMWTGYFPAESTKYDNAFWKSANATMTCFEGDYYYSKKVSYNYELCVGNLSSPDEYTVLRTVSDTKSMSDEGARYNLSVFRIVPFVSDGQLYYNSARKIYRYDSSSDSDEIAYVAQNEYGFIVPQVQLMNGNFIYLHCKYSVSGSSYTTAYSEPVVLSESSLKHTIIQNIVEPTDTTEGYTEYYCNCGEYNFISDVKAPLKYNLGDINSDGTVDAGDLIYFSRHLAKWNEYLSLPYTFNADINDDGNINAIDLIYLGRHLANWNGYTALPSKYNS